MTRQKSCIPNVDKDTTASKYFFFPPDVTTRTALWGQDNTGGTAIEWRCNCTWCRTRAAAAFLPGKNVEGVGADMGARDQAESQMVGCQMIVWLHDCIEGRHQHPKVTSFGDTALCRLKNVTWSHITKKKRKRECERLLCLGVILLIAFMPA